MPKTGAFAETFATLRGVLEPYAAGKLIAVEKPGDYRLCSASMKDRAGKPLFVAAVQIRKNYVSFHLMPVYTCPKLLNEMSPALRKRMQGKSCLNFTMIDPAHVDELAALTKRGIESFKNIKLPWA
jgi:hypothetical protein